MVQEKERDREEGMAKVEKGGIESRMHKNEIYSLLAEAKVF